MMTGILDSKAAVDSSTVPFATYDRLFVRTA